MRVLPSRPSCSPAAPCDPGNGFPVFAFRLHQFISRGDTVFASIEAEADRHLTLDPQPMCPDTASKLLFPLVFCRECGQEYYSVVLPEGNDRVLEPKPIDFRDEVRGEPGLPLSLDHRAVARRHRGDRRPVPESWVEEGPAAPADQA